MSLDAHTTMARYARALNYSGGELADALGVSPSTAYGWLQVAAGEPVSPRRPGHAPPAPELLAKARALVEAHAAEVASVLRLTAPPAAAWSPACPNCGDPNSDCPCPA